MFSKRMVGQEDIVKWQCVMLVHKYPLIKSNEVDLCCQINDPK